MAKLHAQNAEQASRLETYEKLEQELDQVTMQAAESTFMSVAARHFSVKTEILKQVDTF